MQVQDRSGPRSPHPGGSRDFCRKLAGCEPARATLTIMDARVVQRERAPAAQRRLSVTVGVERDRASRRCGSGAKATGGEWREESAPAGARQGRRYHDRRACDRERSWRMVVLGRRIARGGRERGGQAVSARNEWSEPQSKQSTGAVAGPARAIQAGLGRCQDGVLCSEHT